MGTHESQRHPDEVKEEAQDFLSEMKKKVVGPHRDKHFIINMDQTPVYFSMEPSKTLELIGRKTVHVRKSTNDTKRATVAVSITASGIILPSVVVFKGAKNGRIAQNEFGLYPPGHFYACQKNAWMDERVMLFWAEKVLKPHVESAPEHVIPLLILDSYRCHMMSSVVQAIQEMGVEVTHIPGGCTSLCPSMSDSTSLSKQMSVEIGNRGCCLMALSMVLRVRQPVRRLLAGLHRRSVVCRGLRL